VKQVQILQGYYLVLPFAGKGKSSPIKTNGMQLNKQSKKKGNITVHASGLLTYPQEQLKPIA